MKTRLLVIITYFILSQLSLHAQLNNTNYIISEGKGYALCQCIKNEINKINALNKDSTNTIIFKDYSGSYFIQIANFPIQLLDSITQYYATHIDAIRAIPMEKNKTNPTANMIGYTCWKFYESKNLILYIKKLLINYKK